MTIDGQCHCGAVRLTARIDPTRVTICHCTDCHSIGPKIGIDFRKA